MIAVPVISACDIALRIFYAAEKGISLVFLSLLFQILRFQMHFCAVTDVLQTNKVTFRWILGAC
jgi:hypothetical protein